MSAQYITPLLYREGPVLLGGVINGRFQWGPEWTEEQAAHFREWAAQHPQETVFGTGVDGRHRFVEYLLKRGWLNTKPDRR